MNAERYLKLLGWFDAHPTAKRAVIFADRWLPAVPFAGYPVLLILLNVQLAQLLHGGQGAAALDLMQRIAHAILVPGIVFWLGTLLREKLDRPRPYDQPNFVPLVPKGLKGHSFPSRHALSAAVLSMVWLYFYPVVGRVMAVVAVLICALRVLTGVHFVQDVVCGAAMGFVLGAAGMWLF